MPPGSVETALESQDTIVDDVVTSSALSRLPAPSSTLMISIGLILLQVWLQYEVPPHEIPTSQGPLERPTKGQKHEDFDLTYWVDILGWLYLSLGLLKYTVIAVFGIVLLSPLVPNYADKGAICVAFAAMQYTVRKLMRPVRDLRDREMHKIDCCCVVEVLQLKRTFTWYGKVRIRGVAAVQSDCEVPKTGISVKLLATGLRFDEEELRNVLRCYRSLDS